MAEETRTSRSRSTAGRSSNRRGGGGPRRGDGGPRRGGGGPRRGWRRRVRRCYFCVEGIAEIDYKNVEELYRFLSSRGKIRPRRQTGTCARHQRQLAQAIKRARHLALLPFTAEHIRGA